MPVVYDKDQGMIRKVEVILIYPQIDDDCPTLLPVREITVAIK